MKLTIEGIKDRAAWEKAGIARKPGADTRMEKEEIDVDILDKTYFPCRFSVTYGTAGKRYHTLCDPARKRKRKYYLV